MNKKKIVLAEIIIVVVIALSLLLPRIIGEGQIQTSSGYINTIEDLNGHTIGVTTKRQEDEIVSEYLPSSSQLEFASIIDGTKAIKENKIDGFLCDYSDAVAIVESDDDLVIYQFPYRSKKETIITEDDFYYFVVRKQDCAYAYTTQRVEDLKDKEVRIACLTGTESTNIFNEYNSNVVIDYYDNYIDLYTAVSSSKIDYCFGYEDAVFSIIPEYKNVAAIAKPLCITSDCFATSKSKKGDKLIKEFDGFLKEMIESGKYEQMDKKWASEKQEDQILEEVNLTGENGKLKVCTPGTWFGKTYIKDNQITGLFVDICNLFCEEYGYVPEYIINTFTGEIAGLSSGEYDLMADICEETEERKQSVNFTRPVYVTYGMIFTKADNIEYKTVSKAEIFFSSLKEKFHKNFIEQNRYKMIFEGLWTTTKISLLAVLFGTILGAIICMMRMSNKVFFHAFARIYIKAVQGTPIVVLLLILYYVVFSNINIGALAVSVLGFTIDFSAYAAEIFRSSIEAIPEGQAIAARALGFSRAKAFSKVVLPQALISIIPVYSGQFISLVKSTSVVGYIAVQDLTKMSDLIRSATYEAFFPLISTAIIYFLISIILIQVLKIISNRIDPQRRPRVPKGVKANVI